MNAIAPIYIDATMLYRWRHLAPVGIVRLERMLSSHLRFDSDLGPTRYLLWARGYRDAEAPEEAAIDQLLRGDPEQDALTTTTNAALAAVGSGPATSRHTLPALRRAGLKAIARIPDSLRPFAEQAAWSLATLGVETGRYARRARERRRTGASARGPSDGAVRHRVDFSGGGDLVALGLGWEYLDHEAMYVLRQTHGLRIHMPAFDLIPVVMPQMNAGQSHLVHRYYAEMAHYADSITSISNATADALRAFYEREELRIPNLSVNPLPGFRSIGRSGRSATDMRRHRFEGQDFVLSVSTVEVRKNHLLLAKIWAECVRDGLDMPRLVIVGRVGWDVNELMQWVFHAPELDNLCTIVSDVEDDELVEMYTDCLFTLFPSRVEGWGLPITEALTHGRVCVHATDPAQFEASQSLMPAYHPDDFVGWKSAIVGLLTDDPYRAELEARIAERYVRRTADDYCRAYEAILRERRGDPS